MVPGETLLPRVAMGPWSAVHPLALNRLHFLSVLTVPKPQRSPLTPLAVNLGFSHFSGPLNERDRTSGSAAWVHSGEEGPGRSHTAGPDTESTGSWEQLDSRLPAPPFP